MAELRDLEEVLARLDTGLLALWAPIRSEPPLDVVLLKLLGLIQRYG